MAREEGFGVLAEIGKKDSDGEMIDPARAVDQIFADLAHGAYKVIIREGRTRAKGGHSTMSGAKFSTKRCSKALGGRACGHHKAP